MSAKYGCVNWEKLHSLVAKLALALNRDYVPQVVVGLSEVAT